MSTGRTYGTSGGIPLTEELISALADEAAGVVRWTSDGQPVPFTPVFEDRSLDHQIVFTIRYRQIAVSCNCLPRRSGKGAGRGGPRPVIGVRETYPLADAIADWQAWHGTTETG